MKKLFLTFVTVTFLVGGVFSQSSSNIPLIGSKAPSFTAKSTNGKVKFPDDFGKDWKILFSHPQDFTPVCSSELLELAYMEKDFSRLGVQIAVISTDDVDMHNMWKAHLEELDYKDRGRQQINFAILDDSDAKASKIYGMLHEPASTNRDIRGVFIIDSENIVRSINFYPMQVGRNMQEIVRIVEALQTTDESQVLTPANWENGDDVMVPYFPYTKAELKANPELEDKFYSMGNRMWFKKIADK